MRHCLNVEKGNNEAQKKQKDIEDCQAEIDRKHEKEDAWRKSALRDMATNNLKMHSKIKKQVVKDRLESLKEKIDIQTSLQSKR